MEPGVDYAIVWEQSHRSYQEDRYTLCLDFGGEGQIFGGVYDGHRGAEAAEYAAHHLHERFFDLLATLPPTEAFTAAYEAISDKIEGEWPGACAASFFIKGGDIFHANAGDARIIVIGDKERQLTTDHRVDVSEERQRIESMGGVIEGKYVYRDEEGLMPTRSLGDHYFKVVGVIATPAVGFYQVTPHDRFLIAATDGLFDNMPNGEVGEIARMGKSAEEVAQMLKQAPAMIRRGSDNLTIIVLKL